MVGRRRKRRSKRTKCKWEGSGSGNQGKYVMRVSLFTPLPLFFSYTFNMGVFNIEDEITTEITVENEITYPPLRSSVSLSFFLSFPFPNWWWLLLSLSLSLSPPTLYILLIFYFFTPLDLSLICEVETKLSYPQISGEGRQPCYIAHWPGSKQTNLTGGHFLGDGGDTGRKEAVVWEGTWRKGGVAKSAR